MNPYYQSRPPKTAKISRRIWDIITILQHGREPYSLWRNWNGCVFGYQLGDADYGCWKVGVTFTKCHDVPDDILIVAGVRMGNMLMEDWYKKYRPDVYQDMINDKEALIKKLDNLKEA